ncbi:MAG: hypothetical protein ABI640_13065 [Gammaproteobacteria bacterium]
MRHLEEGEQLAVLQWASLTQVMIDDGPRVRLAELIIAIPNGAHLAGDERQRAMQMARLKRIGLKPGVADLLVTVARGASHGLWIEMKKPRGAFGRALAKLKAAVSAEQLAFGALQARVGYRHAICYGFEEARAVILGYLGEVHGSR